MRGFPKCINSKQDLVNLLAMPEFKDKAKAKLKEFKDNQKAWETAKDKLANGDPGITNETHRVTEQIENGKTLRYQQEHKKDPMCPYIRLKLESIPGQD